MKRLRPREGWLACAAASTTSHISSADAAERRNSRTVDFCDGCIFGFHATVDCGTKFECDDTQPGLLEFHKTQVSMKPLAPVTRTFGSFTLALFDGSKFAFSWVDGTVTVPKY